MGIDLKTINFPDRYPTGSLIGMIDLQQTLS